MRYKRSSARMFCGVSGTFALFRVIVNVFVHFTSLSSCPAVIQTQTEMSPVIGTTFWGALMQSHQRTVSMHGTMERVLVMESGRPGFEI